PSVQNTDRPPLICVSADQRGFSPVWRRQDSNLGRLSRQSYRPHGDHAVTWSFLSVGALPPHRDPTEPARRVAGRPRHPGPTRSTDGPAFGGAGLADTRREESPPEIASWARSDESTLITIRPRMCPARPRRSAPGRPRCWIDEVNVPPSYR